MCLFDVILIVYASQNSCRKRSAPSSQLPKERKKSKKKGSEMKQPVATARHWKDKPKSLPNARGNSNIAPDLAADVSLS